MFEISDKVICVDASMQTHTVAELRQDMPQWVKQDNVYTIRGFTDNNGIVDGVWLEELHNPPKYFKLIGRFQEPAFALWRFKKQQEQRITIQEEQEETINQLNQEYYV
jgi:hypothetical protein